VTPFSVCFDDRRFPRKQVDKACDELGARSLYPTTEINGPKGFGIPIADSLVGFLQTAQPGYIRGRRLKIRSFSDDPADVMRPAADANMPPA